MPRITFGIIVLNGEPFVRYILRTLYPFAHQIVVVEGASSASATIASPEGHSVDGTLDTLLEFKANEDPENRLLIVTAESEGYPDGFWPGEKDQQSQAYASRATGDYLWQVDIDEFYKPEDVEAVLRILKENPAVAAVTFKTINFWGSFDYVVDGWYLRRGAAYYHRLFRWGEGYRYITHRPPTVHDSEGRNLHEARRISGQSLARSGIFIYHYSLLFPKQVIEKCTYYARASWASRGGAQLWAREHYQELHHPFRVHNVYECPSWLERFHGAHPPQIEAMRQDIATGRLQIGLRETEDVERLLRSPVYSLGRSWLKVWDRCDRGRLSLALSLRNHKRQLTSLLQQRAPLADRTRTKQGEE